MLKDQNILFVSIIVPNYNHASFLDDRFQSILYQTYQNFELIILDDKSTDNSIDVINKYKNDPHVSHVVLNEDNSGSTFKQWDKGLRLAKGELIWIAESDDSCMPTFLEKSVNNFLSDHRCVISYSCSERMDNQGNKLGKMQSSLFSQNLTLPGRVFNERYMYRGAGIMNASAVVFLRKAVSRVDKMYMDYKSGGDRLFWMEIAKQGDVCVNSDPLNFFRFHGNNTTGRYFLDGTSFFEAKKTYDFIKSNYNVSMYQLFLIKSYYIDKIKKRKFANEDIKIQLLKCWSTDFFIDFYLKCRSYFEKCRNKLGYYHSRIRVLRG